MGGRDKNGRFTKGNTFGKGGNGGRLPRSVEDKWLKRLSSRVSQRDWDKIIDVAVARARAGDDKARRWLSDYLMGKPIARHELDVDTRGGIVTQTIIVRELVDADEGN